MTPKPHPTHFHRSDKRRHVFNRDARWAASMNEGKRTLSGYAIVWGAVCERWYGQATMLPNSATWEGTVFALFHHDWRVVLGRTDNGTLRLASDATGLKVEIDLPDTQAGRDTYTSVARGDITGMSFSMIDVLESTEKKDDDGTITVEFAKFVIDEVTITAIPAFEETSIEPSGGDDDPDDAPEDEPPPEQASRSAAAAKDRARCERLRLHQTSL